MTIQDILQKRNLYYRNINFTTILSKEEMAFLKQEIIKLNQNGMSFTKISKELDIERPTIRAWMKSINYQIINKHNELKVRDNLFDVIETEEDAYWLGFIYADGYISDGGMFELCLKYTDYGHLIKFAKYCEYDINKIVSKQKTNFTNSFRCRLSFAAQHLKSNFTRQGIIPRKSLILTFPL